MTGWTHYEDKPASIVVPKSTWTRIATFGVDLPDGPTLVNAQLYATLPNKPTGTETIITRLVRDGRTDADERYTQRHVHALGDRVSWSSALGTGIEWLTPDDLPLAVEVYHTFVPSITFTTVIVKALNPAAYTAGAARLVIP